MPTESEIQFHRRMLQIADDAQSRYRYPATRFRQDIATNGGLKTAKKYLEAREPQEGFTNLFMRGGIEALMITVEGVIVFEHQWRSLFTEAEVDVARSRLAEYGVPLDAA
jgi:hypothetical protein